jgi:hypothetical protein
MEAEEAEAKVEAVVSGRLLRTPEGKPTCKDQCAYCE